jgi:hypothetical protein
MISTADTKPTTRTRSPMGEALMLHQRDVEHCEALYEAAQGEVTDDVAEAEAARDLSAKQALEALARYHRWLDERDHQVAVEREALDRFAADTAKRRAWADAKIAALAETVAPERTKIQAGTRTIKLRRTTAVETSEALDLAALPPSWRREKPERVIPATTELNKKAAAADMLLGYREGPPPAAGWYDVEGHGRVYLWLRDDGPDPSAWAIGYGPEDGIVAPTLEAAGLSIEPEPGLDVLRWKPSPPGVTLVHRTHVKVE